MSFHLKVYNSHISLLLDNRTLFADIDNNFLIHECVWCLANVCPIYV